MAYQNYKQQNKKNSYGWWSSPSISNEEYQYEGTCTQQTSRHHHQHNKNKGRVAFYDEPIVEAREAESINERFQHARFGDHSAFESVDQEADAFIQYEHKRMELAKLMSMRTA